MDHLQTEVAFFYVGQSIEREAQDLFFDCIHLIFDLVLEKGRKEVIILLN